MSRRYYTSRKKPGQVTLADLFSKLENLFGLYRDKDYFKGKAGITKTEVPESIMREAAIALTFQLFPISEFTWPDITEDRVFDAIEFLYDYVSKLGDWISKTDETNWNYFDFDAYDDDAGRADFRKRVNAFLADYKSGYELTEDGMILTAGIDGSRHILNAEIIPYGEANVDSKVRGAIVKWRNRHLSLDEKKEAIRELSDVFEWLKKTKGLEAVLDSKDESAIFDIANNFAIRHHNPKQKSNYDRTIWYAWIFHFYLATYHAAVRLLVKKEKTSQAASNVKK